jgi:type IV pilus assembly protein PilM
MLDRFRGLLHEPPPSMAFEVSEAGVAVAPLKPRGDLGFHAIKPGVISVSPLRDNILNPDELAAAVRAVAGPNGNRKRRDAALILPDYCSRLTVLDFDEFPSDRKEQASLVRFRLKKSVPFDLESAAVSYCPQPAGGKKVDVVAAVAPYEIISRYETPFRLAGLAPGFVTLSSLAFLDMVAEKSLAVVAKMSGHVLSVMVTDKGALKLARCLELGSADLADIAADLYPTFVYVEDQLGAKAAKLLLAGFGERTEAAREQFHRELDVEVEAVRTPLGLAGQNNAGLLGYLRSVSQGN